MCNFREENHQGDYICPLSENEKKEIINKKQLFYSFLFFSDKKLTVSLEMRSIVFHFTQQ